MMDLADGEERIKSLQQGAFAVAADGSPDRSLLTSQSDMHPLQVRQARALKPKTSSMRPGVLVSHLCGSWSRWTLAEIIPTEHVSKRCTAALRVH